MMGDKDDVMYTLTPNVGYVQRAVYAGCTYYDHDGDAWHPRSTDL